MGKNRLFDIFPGKMPAEDVYRTLGIEIDEGEVKFSSAAQRHALQNHPSDVPRIIPNLSQLITSPLYIGDDHRNPGKIEIVGRIPGHDGAALVALTVEKDERDGCYQVCSTYFINQSELDRKRHKGILRSVKIRP